MESPGVTVSYLEILPLEIVEVLCKFLSVKDLSSCCATSRRMRDVFGSDFVWASRSDRALVQYLKKTPCRVKPVFMSPESDDSTLSPISLRRLDYMRQNRLWNNWRCGRFVEENLIRVLVYDFPPSDTFLNDDCVIVQFYDRLEIRNVKEFPHKKAAEDIDLSYLVSYKWQVIGAYEYILIVVHSLVLVYKVSLSTRETRLTQAFVVYEPLKLDSPNGPLVLEEVVYSRLIVTEIFIHNLIYENLFAGVVHNESKLHIWNYHTGVKLKEQECPLENVSLKNMKCSNKLILLVTDKWNVKTCLVYDLTTLSYLPFRVSFEGSGGIYTVSDYVAISTSDPKSEFHRYLDVYNFNTSDSVLVRENIQPPCKSFGDNFIFIQNNKLKLFCPSDKTVQLLDLDRVLWFHVVNHRYILIRNALFRVKMAEFDKSFEVFSWIYRKNILDFSINRTSTRMVDGSTILHFW